MPATYVTARAPDLESRLLAALRAGDEGQAEALLAAHRESVNGYEASAQLLALMMQREADDLPPAARIAWLERAVTWAARCAPPSSAEHGLPALIAALRAGRSFDDLVPIVASVDPACSPLALSAAVSRWNATYLECVVRNPGPAASAPCALHAEAEGDGGTALFAHRFEVDALEPGAETARSLGWPAFVPRLTRLALRPA
jgi:hypothetical protein